MLVPQLPGDSRRDDLVDDHVEGPAELACLPPDEPSGDPVVTDAPPGPLWRPLQVLAADLLLGPPADVGEEISDIGVMGTEHGEVVSLAGRQPGFFEFEFDSGGCPPQPGDEPVGRTGEVVDDERWGQVG